MEDDGSIFPFEFHVHGTPVSLQGRTASIQRWKTEVARAAQRRADSLVEWLWLEPVPLSVSIYYFPTAPMGGDIDNIIKPIMDALIGIAYLDDQFIEKVSAQKFEPEQDWMFTAPSEHLSLVLDTVTGAEIAIPIVYVIVEDNMSWRSL